MSEEIEALKAAVLSGVRCRQLSKAIDDAAEARSKAEPWMSRSMTMEMMFGQELDEELRRFDELARKALMPKLVMPDQSPR